jgi:PAS domain S-box-containing protein
VQASASCQAEAKADVSQRRSSPFLFTGEALAPKKSPGVGELRSVIPGLISIGFLLAAFLLGEGTSAWQGQARPWITLFLVGAGAIAFVGSTLAASTIRKRGLKAERSESRFQSLLESTSDAIVVTTKAGRIVLGNVQAEKLFGFTSEELRLTPIERLIRRTPRERQAEPCFPELSTSSSRRQRTAYDYLGVRKDKSEFPIEASFSAMETEDGLFIIHSLRDVTEQRASERRRAARHAARAILAEAGDLNEALAKLLAVVCQHLGWDTGAFWAAAPDRYPTMIPVASCRPRSGAALGSPGVDGACAEGQALIRRAWETGQPAWAVDAGTGRAILVFPILSGEEVVGVLELTSRAARQPDEGVLETVANIAAQIGDRMARRYSEEALRRSQEQLWQLQKMDAMGTLAGGIAHDFNNLLTVILGCSDHLLALGAECGQRLDLLGMIKKSGVQAAALTRQLLAFSRRQVLVPQVLNLNMILEDMEGMLGRILGKDVEVRWERAADLHQVRVDHGQIQQILMNLAANARDAMPKGGRLTVQTANVERRAEADAAGGPRPGSYVRLTVTDTGCGMDEAVKRRLFEPFFTTKPVGKGTGLGLATVFGIVTQSGGSIEVQSEPGQGATFHIDLPCAELARSLADAGYPAPEAVAAKTSAPVTFAAAASAGLRRARSRPA